MNAVDDIRIRTGSVVTEDEAVAVVAWCRDWYADCELTFVDGDDYASPDVIGIAALLRGCDRWIDGGLRFVLDDVRRCAAKGMSEGSSWS